MRSIASAALIFLAACLTAKAQSWGASIQGIYLTVDGGAQVSIAKTGDGTYVGKIVWLKEDKARLDVNNPDQARRGDRVQGLVILRGFAADEQSKRWEGGTIYDPKNGKTYDGYIWRDPKDPRILQLKCYILGIKWLGRATQRTVEKRLRD